MPFLKLNVSTRLKRITILIFVENNNCNAMRVYRKQRENYRKMGKGYYHFCTDGWKDGNIFNTIAQFAYGMMLIGIISVKYPLVIYDFELMPNHIHIILSGTGANAVEAFLYLKMKLNARLVKDGYNPLPADYGFVLKPIKSKEQMVTEILYLHRNHYEKQYAAIGGYPWGSAYLHYSLLAKLIDGKRVSEMTARELESLTGTRIPLPAHWQFHPKLGLLPKSFVDTRMVNKLFYGVKDYSTRLVKDYESFVTLSRELGEEVEFSDIEIKDILSKLLLRDYQGKSVYKLSAEEKGRLAVTLSRRFGISNADIAQAMHISLHIVSQFVNSKDYGRAAVNAKKAKSV